MNKKEYQKLVTKHMPKENKKANLIKSFLIGGLIGVIGEALIEFYSIVLNVPVKTAGTYMIITLIFIASLLTGLGFFDNLVTKFQAGLIVPITGFAHAMTSSALEHKKEGLVTGIGANIFKLAGSVILFGVVSAYVFGMLRIIIGG